MCAPSVVQLIPQIWTAPNHVLRVPKLLEPRTPELFHFHLAGEPHKKVDVEMTFMQTDGNDLGHTNTNTGDNQNQMDNLAAGGNIKQSNEIHQHYHLSEGGTVISDPNSQNFWIDVCEWVASLPISETKILGTLVGTGSIGIMAMLGLTTPWNGLAVDPSQYQLLFGIGFVSVIFLGFAVGYVETDTQACCPSCNERFALRPVEVRKTDRTMRENGQDIIHGERDMECRNCGFEETQTDTWSPEEFAKLQSA